MRILQQKYDHETQQDIRQQTKPKPATKNTCEYVFTEFRHAPVDELQNRIDRSVVPPPEASRLLWKGHQASALTAPEWCPRVKSGEIKFAVPLC